MSRNPKTDERDTDRFENAPISRREFVRLSAALGGALALPGTALGARTSSTYTARYEFIVDHVERGVEIPTLATLANADGVAELEAAGFDPVRTTDREPAAYLRITSDEAPELARLDAVTELRFSPGSNPFWRLGTYDDGVFPAVEDSVDYIDFDQLVDGMGRLQATHADRLRFYSIGESPGHYNRFREVDDPRDVYVAEVTNDVDDTASFREKEKVLFVLSIHGDERSGAEAGTRFVEQLLRGDEPAIEALLDDVVLVFLYANPDGWVSRNQEYGFDREYWGSNTHNSFKRETATKVDPNRIYPTVGWIPSSHYPAEPTGRNLEDDSAGVDEDVTDRYTEMTPDALSIVDHLRGYENLRYGSDLHGMFSSPTFIEGLLVNDQYDHAEFHDLDELNRIIERRLEALLTDRLAENRSRFRELNRTIRGPSDSVPERAYDYGTILDTIGYTTSGSLASWLSNPAEQGGLGMTMMVHEMGWDNRGESRMQFRPWLASLQVDGYQEVIRSVSQHVATAVDATIETNGRTSAFVETGSLERHSNRLSFSSDTGATSTTRTVSVTDEPAGVTVTVPDGTTELVVGVDPSEGFVTATLSSPTAETVRTFSPSEPGRALARTDVEWFVEAPAAGDWEVSVTPVGDDAVVRDVDVHTTVLVTGGIGAAGVPSPADALGYDQRPYSVSPLTYFDDYRAYVSDEATASETVAGMGIDAIADGALLGASAGEPVVDSLVVNHTDGSDRATYVDALASYVSAGGDLILTDTGVNLLGQLDAGSLASIGARDIDTVEFTSVALSEKDEDHPLLAGVRDTQSELWKPGPMGYSVGGAPATVVDTDAFEDAGGSVAGIGQEGRYRTTEWVVAGSLPVAEGTVHVIGGLLPPAEQGNLHPFGVREYSASFLGHTIFVNALGHTQTRKVEDEQAASSNR
ncbi:M14 family zinc carboxypeptidase [Haloarchaeobius sp. DT45]|uniref:M14 family zinc carboxypeptidase n=1 Tax=Haloarchaeobius sp. DT45 TaxID=3446116 RepID=UPI003F6B0FB4